MLITAFEGLVVQFRKISTRSSDYCCGLYFDAHATCGSPTALATSTPPASKELCCENGVGGGHARAVPALKAVQVRFRRAGRESHPFVVTNERVIEDVGRLIAELNHRGGGAGRASSDGAAGGARGRLRDAETQAPHAPENRHPGGPATPPGLRHRVYPACER
jgi:hypothetical protein